MAVNKSSKRVKLVLTRMGELPSPLHIYTFLEDIRYFVVCTCNKNCEITIYMADGNKHYIDNSPDNLSILTRGVEDASDKGQRKGSIHVSRTKSRPSGEDGDNS
jgi:hypothetical protein